MLEYVQDGCFSFQFYIKPQLAITILALACRCFSFQFYIKPQQTAFSVRFQHGCFSFQFYIKPQHHRRCRCSAEGCFSFQFYIKPQHMSGQGNDVPCCFSFQFYIKPQRPCKRVHLRGVVSHSNSTSNHNPAHMPLSTYRLFLIPILHQTTTLYSVRWKRLTLFLIPILHQTTTSSKECGIYLRCFSFQFYIKPQRSATNTCNMSVVSHSNSTSNHNLAHGSNSYSARYTYDTDA